ncbi:SMI1/KNR4 family protein [Acinetobacter sp. 194]|uniref:SMI1/KNR4 family protein n=1 Tax=Acinetobacter shaoyimingii TaxID=2715164 RepID=UPI00140A5ABF|nr:SMI1/KNR4 family protein [Acinetobacter shaoyimingii]NHB59584.1 SMI1/KNR4 family protein [Acinetobacter shaoyimingii]
MENIVNQLKNELNFNLSKSYKKFLGKFNDNEYLEYEYDDNLILLYNSNLLIERNNTYEIQKYEPNYLLIGQDGDLGFFIKNNEDNIYKNDLGAIGSLEMKKIASSIDDIINND